MNKTTPRVFQPTPTQVRMWKAAIASDPPRVLIFYVGTQSGMTVEIVEERLRDAGMPLDNVRVFQPKPEDGEFFEELRGRKGIGIVKGDRGEDPLNILRDLEVYQLDWVYYGGSESDTTIKRDEEEIFQSGWDEEDILTWMVVRYPAYYLIDVWGDEAEEILEQLDEYPHLEDYLGDIRTELATRGNY